MKRQIEFKFWLGHTKKMTYEHSLIEIANIFWDFTEDIIPLQFTGMVDIKENDIYEGDIVIIPSNIYPQPFEVRYFAPSFDILCVPTNVHIPLSSHNEYEIIGNIYENPELLVNKI